MREISMARVEIPTSFIEKVHHFGASAPALGSTTGAGVGRGGTVFELSSGSWAFDLLSSLIGGEGPLYSNLIFDQAGNLYGTTYADGNSGYTRRLAS